MCIYRAKQILPTNRTISFQSTPMLKNCIYTCLKTVDTAFSYERGLIVCSFLWEKEELSLTCNAHTAFLLYGVYLPAGTCASMLKA